MALPVRMYLFLLVCIWTPSYAVAHAELVSSQPSAAQVLAESPSSVSLNFSEAVRPVYIRLLSANGDEVTLKSAPTVVGHSVVQVLDGSLADGRYWLSWRVVSADSHPVGKTLYFDVGDPGGATSSSDVAAVSPADASWVAWLNTLCRMLYLASLFSLAGSLCIVALRPKRFHVERYQWQLTDQYQKLIGLVGLAAAGQLALLTVRLSGGVPDISEVPTWLMWALQTPTGLVLASHSLVAALLLGSKVLSASTGWHGATASVALMLVATLGLMGHAIAHPYPMRTVLLLTVHAIVAASWFGSLPVLKKASYHVNEAEMSLLLRLYSKVALPAVIVLLAAGVVLAWLYIPRVSDLWESRYGQLLTAKLVVIALILSIALHNRFLITAELAGHFPNAMVRLRKNLTYEWRLILLVLLITSMLVNSMPPGSSLPESTRASLTVSEEKAGWYMTLNMDTRCVGSQKIEVTMRDAEGNLLLPQAISMTLSRPDLSLEPLGYWLSPESNGYVLETEALAIAGSWLAELQVLVTDFEYILFDLRLPIETCRSGGGAAHHVDNQGSGPSSHSH